MDVLAVAAALPDEFTDQLPIVLVHGAANSGAVWAFWQRELAARGRASYAIDLRGHGRSYAVELSCTSMRDYAADVATLVKQFRRPPVLVGWSMGGLVAMMLSASNLVSACVAVAPSLPTRQADASVALRTGQFGPEEYGITSRDPDEQPAMPDLDREERVIALASLGRESRLARDERRRGVVIEALTCPLLVLTGTLDRQWPRERYEGLWLAADHLIVDGASHWGLVLNRRVLPWTVSRVVQWVEQAIDGW